MRWHWSHHPMKSFTSRLMYGHQYPDDRIRLIVVTAAKWPPDRPACNALTTWFLSDFSRQRRSWSSGPIWKRTPLIKVKGAALVWNTIFSSRNIPVGYPFPVRYPMISSNSECSRLETWKTGTSSGSFFGTSSGNPSWNASGNDDTMFETALGPL